jgi:hypothetical protein
VCSWLALSSGVASRRRPLPAAAADTPPPPPQVEASLPRPPAGAAPLSTGVASGGAPAGRAGWTQLRMAHLLEDTGPSGAAAGAGGAGAAAGPAVAAGLYACSPTGPGFAADFRHLTCFAGRVGGVP